MATRTYTSVKESSAAPTFYKIHSRESFKRSWWSLPTLVVPIVAVEIGLFLSQSDSVDLEQYHDYFKDDNAMVAGTVFVTVVLLLLILYYCYYLFSTTNQTRDVELSVTICPIGIQRSTTTTTTYNSNKNRQRSSVRHYPLLPLESVKDCILLEHVGGFSVTSHVMIRVKATPDEKNDSVAAAAATATTNTKENPASELVSVFHGAKLTFDQCHDLVHQIRSALEELQ